MNGHSPVPLRRSEKTSSGAAWLHATSSGSSQKGEEKAAGIMSVKCILGGCHSSPSSLSCHLVTSTPALNARLEGASLLKPSLGMLLENQSPVWWVGNGTPTQPSSCDSLGTLFLCSEPWFPPVFRGDGDYTPSPSRTWISAGSYGNE